MAAVSYSISRGQSGSKVSDFTRGTSAPGANDIEIRINTTDAQSAAITVKDIILALDAFRNGVLSDAILGNDWGI